MAKGKKTGGLLSRRLTETGVREETRFKEAQPPGGGSLPPGIEDGIAKVRMIKFSSIEKGDNKGDVLLYSDATVVEPRTFIPSGHTAPIKVEGRLAQFGGITIGETKNRKGEITSFEDNWAKAENRLKLLGVPMEDIDDSEVEEVVSSYAEENDLYVGFRTWQGEATKEYPNPRVNVVLLGPVEDYEPEIIDDMTEDDPAEDEEKEEVEKEGPVTPPKRGRGRPPKAKATVQEEPVEEPEESVEEPATVDTEAIISLGRRADKKAKSAQITLSEMCDAAGIDTEDYDTWEDVAQALIELESAEAPSPEDEESDPENPYVEGTIWFYRPPRHKVAVEVEITKVNTKAGTVDLVNMEDSEATYEGVAITKLQEEG